MLFIIQAWFLREISVKNNGVLWSRRLAWAAFAGFCCIGTLAEAQVSVTTFDQSGEVIEEFVVVGSRAAPRSAINSTVPVDVVDVDELASQSSVNLSDLLRSVVPSFHVNVNPSRDSAALLRPVNLRGLAPDHSLVLVNNKRRHRGAVIQWISNGASDGAQGPDISAIPAAAIKQVEVLRDGAAAQYGSDAIAGVLNFVLKDASEGGQLSVDWGFHSEDSSEDRMLVSGNFGLPVGSGGFLNLSGEYSESSSTDRSVQHPDAVAVAAAGVAGVANPAKPWGNPDVRDSIKLFANFGYQANDGMELYAFGNHSTREVETAFFYRSPQGRSGVYVSGGKMLIGGGADCKAQYDYDATAANVPIVRDMLSADPACFAFAEILPAGFTPQFGANITDRSVAGGLRGALDNGFSYDFSASWGQNELDYYINDTVNASLGPATPRDFELGKYIQTDSSVHFDLLYLLDIGMASDLNIASGFEWRKEEFQIVTGERASWVTGPFGADGFSARSNGFGGFNPASSGTWDRNNIALYLDLEADVTDRMRLGGALRWEDFDLFGSVANFKLASRMQLSDAVALRASLGTGFRAPTPGQQNANNLATVVDSATGQFREQGTIASTNPVAVALGGEALDAESSTNYTVGMTVQLDNGLNFTLDWFRIDLEDRIALSAQLDMTEELLQTLLAAGVAEARDFNRVRYFTNDFDTKTQGLDAVLSYGFQSDWGATDMFVRFNYTSTDLTAFGEQSTAARRQSLEKGAPETRLILGLSQAMNRWTLNLHYNHFGDWFDSDDGRVHDGYGLLDLSAQYSFTDNLSILLGSDNLLDNYPSKAARSPSSGRLYPRYSPAGYNGRLLYGRLRFAF